MWNHQNYTIHFLYFIHGYILFLPEQWKQSTKLTQPFSFCFLPCTHSVNPLYLQLTSEEALEREGTACGPILPCHHFQPVCFATQENDTRKKGYDRFPWSFMFLRSHCFLFVFKPSSGSRGLSVPPLNHKCHPSTESHWTPTHQGSPGIPCSHCEHYMNAMGLQRKGPDTYCASCLHSLHAPVSSS